MVIVDITVGNEMETDTVGVLMIVFMHFFDTRYPSRHFNIATCKTTMYQVLPNY